jgi:hypothetical protein
MRWLAVLALAGCSVPPLSLDGKDCPCASGYTCNTATNKCVAMTDAKMPPDTPPGPSCLGSMPSGPLYSDNFDTGSLTGWTTTTMWAQTGGQLVQSDTNDMDAYAVAPASTAARVIADMTGAAGGMGMGIVVRAQPGQPRQHYECIWEPGPPGALLLRVTNNGGAPSTLAQMAFTSPGATVKYTMELSVDSTQTLHCCLDGVSGVTLTARDDQDMYIMGGPGLATVQMHASFDNFAVYSN